VNNESSPSESTITAFLVSAALRDFSRVQYFIEELQVHPDATTRGKPTAICYALLKRDRELLHYLHEHGADLNSIDKMGMTPAHYAAMGGCLYCLSFLILHGADIDRPSLSAKTPYAVSVETNSCLECRQLLRCHGAASLNGVFLPGYLN